MESDFANYEQSLILKELGFDRPCIGYFYKENFIPSDTFDTGESGGFIPFDPILNKDNGDIIGRPLFQQAFRWIIDELRKYKNNFDIKDSKFFIDFESPHESLNNLLDLLLKIKEAEEIGEEIEDDDEETVVAIGQTVMEKSSIEKFKLKANLILELKERIKKNQSEIENLKWKIKSFSKNTSDVKDDRSKLKKEVQYLNEEVEKLMSLNKKYNLEVQKTKVSLVSLSNIKDKLEGEKKISTSTIESLQSFVLKLEKKINDIHFNFAEDLLKRVLSFKKFLWIFDFNKRQSIYLLNLAINNFKISAERGNKNSEEKLAFIYENPKFKKYLEKMKNVIE